MCISSNRKHYAHHLFACYRLRGDFFNIYFFSDKPQKDRRNNGNTLKSILPIMPISLQMASKKYSIPQFQTNCGNSKIAIFINSLTTVWNSFITTEYLLYQNHPVENSYF